MSALRRFARVIALFAISASLAFAGPQSVQPVLGKGLSGVRLLIIRHAEKPEEGSGLTPAGERRAKAYAGYFQHLILDGKPVRLDHIFAARDSDNSMRPRLTVAPLSAALHLPLDLRYSDGDYEALASDLRSKHYGADILICRRHGKIPKLLTALGANSADLIPGDKWPGKVYDWLIELRFDHQGRLLPSAAIRLNEHLMPGDAR